MTKIKNHNMHIKNGSSSSRSRAQNLRITKYNIYSQLAATESVSKFET